MHWTDLPARPTAHPTAADLMTEVAVTVTPNDSLLLAASLMADHGISRLPVLEAGRVVGIVSDRDVRTMVGDPRYITAPGHVRGLHMRDAMMSDATTIVPECPLKEVATQFADDRSGALPVVDGAGKLVGIVSYVDVLHGLVADRERQ
jgi:acetoin utilization protein AcuB